MNFPPTADRGRQVLRAFLEAAAQFTPVTAALARIYQTTHPPKFEADLSIWRLNLAHSNEDHENRITRLENEQSPRILLSELAQELAVWLVKTSEKGLSDQVGFIKIQIAFPAEAKRALEDAATELRLCGLVDTNTALGHPVRLVCPSYELFALFDPIVMGTSPQNDAVEIARIALEVDHVSAHELEERLGWSKRRLNPALALLIRLVADGRIRKVIQPDYATLGFIMAPEERVLFRNLVHKS
jgi:hypothetical protein